MAARKLQTEVDKTFKKVTEGVEVFESIYDKMQAATNQAQKEKLENDLKTQIKKLQRMRDQIKVWLQSNDFKDKQQLTDYRKLIETQMERFKACEKEMKTKAFSRAGLDAAAKLDPKEIAKRDMAEWVSTMTDDLSRQIEHAEAEVEGLQGVGKKKKDVKAATRTAELEGANDRRKWHISRLEIVLRMLENGALDAEKLLESSFKDDVKYYVESNTEEDFEEDEGIYEELNLDEELEAFGMGQDDVLSSHDSTSVADMSDLGPAPKTPGKDPPSGQKRSASISLAADESPLVKKPPGRKPTLDSTTTRPIITAPGKTPGSSAPASGPAPAKPVQTAPLRYASAAAGALAPQVSAAPQATTAVSMPSPPAPVTSVAATSPAEPAPVLSATATSPSAIKDVKTPPALPTTQPIQPPSASPISILSPNGGAAPVLPPGLSAPSPPPLSATSISAHSLPSPPVAVERSAPTPTPTVAATTLSPAPGPAELSIPIRPTSTQPSEASSANKAPPPSSLADLVSTFENAKGKALRKEADLGAIHQILESGYNSLPQAQDADKPKYYVPRTPYQTPSVYPSVPLPHLETPALFSKLDLDTLFYVFYYFQGTYMQYLAAQELKKQSWRFHRQYLTWFHELHIVNSFTHFKPILRRASEPHAITEEYEEGVYLYFDWESAWSTRRKNSFRFNYHHLE